MGKPLNKLVAEMREVEDKLLEFDGEINEQTTKDIVKFEEGHAAIRAKIDSYKYIIDRSKVEALFWKKRKDQIARVQKSYESLGNNLRELLKFAMKNLNVDEIKGEDFVFKLQNGKDSIVYNEKEIEDAYKKQTVITEIDKKKILDDIAMGLDVKGVTVVKNKIMRSYVAKKEK